MAVERLYIENIYIPLTSGLNPSITKAITDVQDPEKRKSTYSKTVQIPRSKEADQVFSQIFEVNLIDLTFNVQAKADCLYTVDDEPIIKGFCKLNEISVNDFDDITYDVTMSSDTANFWDNIRNDYLTDLYTTAGNFEGLDKYDHQYTKEIQAYSWATQVWYNGVFIPFDYGTGYVYPLIDYGFSTDATNFNYNHFGCAIYAKEYIRKIINYAGFEYSSSFIDGSVFDHLIIPSSPANYGLTSAEITDMSFVANTPKFASNNTTKTANLTKNALGSNDQLIFTNDSVAPGTDPGLNYDPATGVFTCVTTGFYDFNLLCDLRVEFKPDTANAVKTRCEVDGYLLLTHTPNGSVTETQINAIPYYITYDDSGAYVSGTRTSNSSPTYPNLDYLDQKSWSIYANHPLVPRPYSIPNRYLLPVSNIWLTAGDEIRVYHKSGVYAKNDSVFSFGALSTNFFIDSGGAWYTGNAKLMCSVGVFYNKVANTNMAEGNVLTMSKVIPANIKMIDFFTSILKMFNLWVDIDPIDPYTLIIEQREDYYSTTTLNIHELIDRSKTMTHIPVGALDTKRFLFNYKSDSDYWNKTYETAYNEIYGNRQVDTLNEWFNTDKVTEVIFSPTPIVGLPNSDRVIPTIYQLTDTNLPIVTKHNIRILYYGGLKSCAQTWNHINFLQGWPYLPLTETYTTYPYAGHWDDAFSPTLDINWGLVKEVYYDDTLHAIDVTDNNLVNAYHSDFISAITDENSRIVKAYVHLTPAMYMNFTFDKLYYFDFAYFRLQKIEGYNPTSEETTLCEFLKLTSIPPFTPSNYLSDGAPTATSAVGGGGGVILDERVPTSGQKSMQQPDGNNYTAKDAVISGEGNTVWAGAKQVEINGYGNLVESQSKNIKIQGDNNIIGAGLENVTLINTNDVTVSESNVTYIGGKKVNSWETKTADFTCTAEIVGYYVDCTSNDVDVTITDRDAIADWEFKRIDNSAFNLTITPTGLTIDGSASVSLLGWEAVRIKWNSESGEFNVF
jgi:hypothetical protein